MAKYSLMEIKDFDIMINTSVEKFNVNTQLPHGVNEHDAIGLKAWILFIGGT